MDQFSKYSLSDLRRVMYGAGALIVLIVAFWVSEVQTDWVEHLIERYI